MQTQNEGASALETPQSSNGGGNTCGDENTVIRVETSSVQ